MTYNLQLTKFDEQYKTYRLVTTFRLYLNRRVDRTRERVKNKSLLKNAWRFFL